MPLTPPSEGKMATLSPHTDVVRVVEVRPRWQKYLLITCAVIAALAGVASLVVQMTQGDEIVARVDPISRLAERTNNGFDRVERTRQAIENVLRRPQATPADPDAAAPKPKTETTYRIGPFEVVRSERRIEIRGARDTRARPAN